MMAFYDLIIFNLRGASSKKSRSFVDPCVDALKGEIFSSVEQIHTHSSRWQIPLSGQQQTLVDAIASDIHVAKTRAANTPIRRPHDLTKYEKLKLVDLLERYRAMRDPADDEEADLFDLWDQFMREIFKRWSRFQPWRSLPWEIPRSQV